jgi:hypothetical protein
MVFRVVPSRRLIATVSLLAVSAALHALLVAGLAGGFAGSSIGQPERQGAPPVRVALHAPAPPPEGAAPATTPAPATAARAPVRPRPRPARPARAPDAGGTQAAALVAPGAPAPGENGEGAASEPQAPGPGEDEARTARAPAADAQADAPAATDAAAAGPQPVPAPAPDPGPPDATFVAAGDASASARPADAQTPRLPPLPPSQRHRFRVFWGDYTDAKSVARLEYRLVLEGERYEIRTRAEAEGLISLVYSGALTQLSTGRIGPGGFEPLRYSEQRGSRPERTVLFDPALRQLKPADGRGTPVPAPPGMQDRLSVLYQIGLLARAEPERFGAGATRELPVATMRDVRIERFEIVGDETLATSSGPIRALHLHRPPPPGTDDPRIDVWLGYDLDMLPVRLRVEDAGQRVLDQVIERGG